MLRQNTTLNFDGQPIYIGIDVHLKSWNVAIYSKELFLKSIHQESNVEVLVNHLWKNYPGASYHSVYEAGFCGFWIHRELQAHGVNNIVVNPADVPSTQKELLHKSDPIDSKKLGRALRAGVLRGVYVPTVHCEQDRSLMRLRHRTVKDTCRFKNRLKSFLYLNGIEYPEIFRFSGSHWSRRFMEWLKQDIKLSGKYAQKTLELLIQKVEHNRELLLQINRELRQMMREPRHAQNYELLRSVPGIGPVTAMSLLVELEDITRFENNDQLASFIGIVPTKHSSGERDSNGELTFRRHSILRRMLVEAAWTAVRNDPVLGLCFSKSCMRMKKNLAIIKTARKLVNRIAYVLKTKTYYVNGIVE
ncbi:IS110 family RNA-guided transposase [Sphingobacterium cellulitidis]|nr:IS110 family transposase [Sphingobacterium soli]MBA8988766.1 transposase [Sphingobacterium soli]OYD43670.1 hypothetical protein CHT99_01475 [Sphingobacterium cellulitidis]OYD43723.1 hypothetical protein CHT99_01750 [Sphingobacterium cellulitidis]